MPADAPGTLGGAPVADVMAYIFQSNQLQPGGAELPHDSQKLLQIGIVAAH